jgi:hypothetical protein
MKTLSEIQNLAREEQAFLAFFQSGTDALDCNANENVMRSWLDEEFLPVTLDNLKACEKAISDSLEKKQKPFVPRPPAPSRPKGEVEPVPERHFLGEEGMSADQLKRVRQGNIRSFDPLPPEITRADIRKANSETLRSWIQKYGNDALTARHNQPIRETK